MFTTNEQAFISCKSRDSSLRHLEPVLVYSHCKILFQITPISWTSFLNLLTFLSLSLVRSQTLSVLSSLTVMHSSSVGWVSRPQTSPSPWPYWMNNIARCVKGVHVYILVKHWFQKVYHEISHKLLGFFSVYIQVYQRSTIDPWDIPCYNIDMTLCTLWLVKILSFIRV